MSFSRSLNSDTEREKVRFSVEEDAGRDFSSMNSSPSTTHHGRDGARQEKKDRTGAVSGAENSWRRENPLRNEQKEVSTGRLKSAESANLRHGKRVENPNIIRQNVVQRGSVSGKVTYGDQRKKERLSPLFRLPDSTSSSEKISTAAKAQVKPPHFPDLGNPGEEELSTSKSFLASMFSRNFIDEDIVRASLREMGYNDRRILGPRIFSHETTAGMNLYEDKRVKNTVGGGKSADGDIRGEESSRPRASFRNHLRSSLYESEKSLESSTWSRSDSSSSGSTSRKQTTSGKEREGESVDAKPSKSESNGCISPFPGLNTRVSTEKVEGKETVPKRGSTNPEEVLVSTPLPSGEQKKGALKTPKANEKVSDNSMTTGNDESSFSHSTTQGISGGSGGHHAQSSTLPTTSSLRPDSIEEEQDKVEEESSRTERQEWERLCHTAVSPSTPHSGGEVQERKRERGGKGRSVGGREDGKPTSHPSFSSSSSRYLNSKELTETSGSILSSSDIATMNVYQSYLQRLADAQALLQEMEDEDESGSSAEFTEHGGTLREREGEKEEWVKEENAAVNDRERRRISSRGLVHPFEKKPLYRRRRDSNTPEEYDEEEEEEEMTPERVAQKGSGENPLLRTSYHHGTSPPNTFASRVASYLSSRSCRTAGGRGGSEKRKKIASRKIPHWERVRELETEKQWARTGRAKSAIPPLSSLRPFLSAPPRHLNGYSVDSFRSPTNTSGVAEITAPTPTVLLVSPHFDAPFDEYLPSTPYTCRTVNPKVGVSTEREQERWRASRKQVAPVAYREAHTARLGDKVDLQREVGMTVKVGKSRYLPSTLPPKRHTDRVRLGRFYREKWEREEKRREGQGRRAVWKTRCALLL